MRILPGRFFPPRAKGFRLLKSLARHRNALEIGGPSDIFRPRGILPIYAHLQRVDNLVWSSNTIWSTFESSIYPFGQTPGQILIGEAGTPSNIADESYDCLLSSHVLEHLANPIRGLDQWKRILKPGGTLALLLPHKDGTFDHRRPTTPLDHLIQDATQEVGEDDLTHLDEILKLHDLTMDPAAGTPEQFKARSLKNLENRCLHQHVFDTRSATALLDHSGWQILHAETWAPHNIIFILRKPSGIVDNSPYLDPQASHIRRSIFPSDHTPAT